MRSSGLRECALVAGCCIVAACSATTEVPRFQPPAAIDGPGDRESRPWTYRVLHSFGAGHDGSRPNALIAVGDTFYGTTADGGTNSCRDFGHCGTFFSIMADGTEKVLHDFGKGNDGRNPGSSLIVAGGTLYGTTAYGGVHDQGTVFSITPGGKEKVLYSFGARPDGQNPTADLIDVGGVLYGTTFAGGLGCGPEGCGTVFSVTMNGKGRVLHHFDDLTDKDGWYPEAGLADVGGTLYGTTLAGGLYGSFGNWGTAFSITRDGNEKVLHYFGNGNDGWFPAADLLDVDGTLYGTTIGGGTHKCTGAKYGGCGTVFSITTDGKEKLVHSFDGGDGSFPAAGLIDEGGTLYGTTSSGGTHSCGPYGGCGTIFSVAKDGSEQVLHDFRAATGYRPVWHMTYKSGKFYGVTVLGGQYGNGPPYHGGVVFSLTP